MTPETLWKILPLAIIVFGLTHLLVPINIRFSNRFGIVARPAERRVHKYSIPEAGGLSFALPIIAMQIVFALISNDPNMRRMLIQFSGVELLTLTTGIFDDRFESSARFKLLWQFIIGLLMYLIGFKVEFLTNPLGSHFTLGWMSLPITILWYMVVLNAINLIDGLDGLATGICVIVSAVLCIVGFREHNIQVIALSALLFAGSLAFLRYNFHPAKIFLGDTGALFIGLNIAAISNAGTEQYKGIASMTLIIPLAVLAVPLLDVFLAIFRRIRVGNIFAADKAHIHHAMLASGLSQKQISIIVYIVTLLFGLIAIGFSFSSKKVLFSLLMAVLMLMVIAAYILMRWEKKK
ncbi:MAG: MraY family glycosyltransferase [Candidatus Cloacimonadaceae bacterium]|nr:MraY family glycosyltransferase [Candidatus Cloacimonadaceae bacterium]MDP3114170.1 MraY family glycosyltransferase [Candidatus Cloacimonadaceae bacterium]